MKANNLPLIPDKKYFSISEVSDLCKVKSHTLRFWEKEFDSSLGNHINFLTKNLESELNNKPLSPICPPDSP